MMFEQKIKQQRHQGAKEITSEKCVISLVHWIVLTFIYIDITVAVTLDLLHYRPHYGLFNHLTKEK